MRIIACSDLHRDAAAAQVIVEASAKADVVVVAGDFAVAGEGAAETLRILVACCAPVVVVHGNHDDPEEISGFCAAWADGHYLHGQAVTLDGVAFFGLGGEIPARSREPWNASQTEQEAAALLSPCPAGAILVTHTPPYEAADLQRDGSHQGSTAIRDAILARQPALHLCGHIHNAWGMTARIGATGVVNLGPRPVRFEV